MSPAVKDLSINWRSKSPDGDGQAPSENNEFWARLLMRMRERRVSSIEVATAIGSGSSTVSNWTKGRSIPSSEQLFKLADFLACSARWLLTGAGESAALFDAADVDWVDLPRYPLAGFTPDGKPEPEGRVPLPRYWLKLVSAAIDKLWVTTVPGNVGDMLSEGEEIVCADLEGSIVDGRIYIFMIDGRTIIRRLFATSEGYQLVTGEAMTPPLTVRGDFAEQGPFPVARVVGKFRFSPM